MKKVIDGVTYKSTPELGVDDCGGCVAEHDAKLCDKLNGCCASNEIIWAKKQPMTTEEIQAKIDKHAEKIRKLRIKFEKSLAGESL